MSKAIVTRITPSGTPAATVSAAVGASERLSDVLNRAKVAGTAVIVGQYGADIDLAAVRLAKRAADELSGSAKSRGGARANVLAVVDYATAAPIVSDTVLVAGARARLDANAAYAKARREDKAALAAKVNDHTASFDERVAAMSVLVGMDDADADAKHAHALATLNAALASAVKNGVTLSELSDALDALIEGVESAKLAPVAVAA